MTTNRILALVATCATALLLGACGSSSSTSGAQPTAQANDAFIATVAATVSTQPDNTEPANVDAIVATAPDDSDPQPVI